VTAFVLKIRHRIQESRKVAKLARALALLDAQEASSRRSPRRVARISLGA
jgi:hypothetical protein